MFAFCKSAPDTQMLRASAWSCLRDSCLIYSSLLPRKSYSERSHAIIQTSQNKWRQTRGESVLTWHLEYTRFSYPSKHRHNMINGPLQVCSPWLTFFAASLFCYSKLFRCGHQQWNGCVCSLSAASRSPDSCFAISTGRNDTPRITNAHS